MVVKEVNMGKPVLTLMPEAKRARGKLRSKSVIRSTAKRKAKPAPSQANKPAAAAPTHEKQTIEKARRERVAKAREWMVATWPEVLNVMEPKPLYLGAGKEIVCKRP